MVDIAELKQKANKLRKEQNFEEALPLYRDLWNETADKYIGAGLIYCLRKMGLFDEAISLADELIVQHPDFEWGCREAS